MVGGLIIENLRREGVSEAKTKMKVAFALMSQVDLTPK